MENSDNELYNEILKSLNENRVKNYFVDKSDEVIETIKEKYVNGTPRVWWLSLKNKLSYDFPKGDGYLFIKKILTKNEIELPDSLYFIVDFDNENQDKMVLKGSLENIQMVIAENQFFEYYICPFNFSWLICENDHNTIIFSQDVLSSNESNV